MRVMIHNYCVVLLEETEIIFRIYETTDHEWKLCRRHYPKKIIQDLSKTLNIPVEPISLHREQELLCKGMFTELW